MDGQVYVSVQASESNGKSRSVDPSLPGGGGNFNVQYRIDFDISTGFTGITWSIPGNAYRPTVDFTQYVVPGNVSATESSLASVFSSLSGASYYAGYIVNDLGCGA